MNANEKIQGTVPLRIAVIGGGLCGLAAAHRLQELSRETGRSCDVTLFEGGAQFGGLVRTQRMHGYLVEMGADNFITNKPGAINLCKRIGLERELLSTDATYRRSLVLYRGRPCAVPDGFQLLTPASIGSILKSPLFSLSGKLRMALEPFIPKGKPADDESLASFVRRRLGRQVLERLVQPMVGGIYTSDPEKLSLRATMPRFLEMERQYGSLLKAMGARAGNDEEKAADSSGARYGLFASLKNGMGDLVARLVERNNEAGVDLRLDSNVASIVRLQEDRAYRVELTDGWRGSFDGVIVALPTRNAANLLAPLNAELAELLKSIEYASSAIVVSGHKLSDIKDPLNAFGLVIPEIERRRILAVSFTSRKFPGRAPEGKVLLRTFVGGAMQPEEFQLNDTEIKGVVERELREILGVKGSPDFMIVSRYPNSMPQYHVGHVALVRKIFSEAETLPNLILAGNAYEGVGIPDTISSGEKAAESFFRNDAGIGESGSSGQ